MVDRLLKEENNAQGTTMLLKLLTTASAAIARLAKVLLIVASSDSLNFSLDRQVGGKLLEALASSLDSNFAVASFASNDAFQLGDIAKTSVTKAASSCTGKEEYSSGNISKVVKEHIDDDDVNISNNVNLDYLN